MNRLLLFLLVTGLTPAMLTVWGQKPESGPRQPSPPGKTSQSTASHRALVDRYCVGCHNTKQPAANLALDSLDVGKPAKGADSWEKVIRKLRSGAMPPAGLPRPDAAAYDALASYLETELERASAANPNPGRTEALHRLNRTEYGNAIRDLLALDIDVSKLLPADAADRHGFDNMAAVLGVSPALFSRYASTAREVSRLAVGVPSGPVFTRYNVPLNLLQDDQASEDLPFGSRGGAAISHYFPVDAEYIIQVRLQNNYTEYIRGIGRPHQVEIRLDGALVKRFTVGGEAPGKPSPGPGGFEGNILGDPEWEHYMHHADEGLEVRIPIKAGPRVVGIAFPREHWEAEGILQPRQFGFALAVNAYQYGNPSLGSVLINGPYGAMRSGDTPSRRRIFVCSPSGSGDEEMCAKKILSTLARRAYRRPVSAKEHYDSAWLL